MKNNLIAPSNELARHLVDLGCPLDTLNPVDDGYESSRRRLHIEQRDYILENQIFDTNAGTGLRISLRIAYGARGKMTICEWDLDLPGMETQVLWLDDPFAQIPAMELYRIPGASHEEFTRAAVINHHRVLRNGDVVEGFLLGYWIEPLPEIYTHGISLKATLSLFDHNHHCFSTPVELWIDRKSRRYPSSRKGVQRPRLFDEQEERKPEEVRELVTSS